jgi:hypothetical protein
MRLVRWLPPVVVAFAFTGAALAPKAPAELQHASCPELPMSPYDHVREDLEGCFAEHAERDAHDVAMKALVIIDPTGTTARVVGRSRSPMLDLCVEEMLRGIGEADGVHLELELQIAWSDQNLQLSHANHLRFPVDGLPEDRVHH